jgi:hypothetical protein
MACSSLTSITLPKAVVSIGDNAFGSCSSLTSITIPENITAIGEYVIAGCSSLTSITLPEAIESIGKGAFRYCSSLTGITLPRNVVSIGDSAFDSCSSLTSIKIPEGVTSIGELAFRGCSSLASVNIPKNVTSIEYGTFAGCISLSDITIPESVVSIGSQAFNHCSSLLSINIPKSVINIGDLAFYRCSSLIEIDIPESVTNIGNYAFEDCSSLVCLNIPEGVISIGDYAFWGCKSLFSVSVPKSVTSVGLYALGDCDIRIIKWKSSYPLTSAYATHSIYSIFFVYTDENGELPAGYDQLWGQYAIDDVFEVLDITNLNESYAPYLNLAKAKKVTYSKFFPLYSYNVWTTIALPFTPTLITHEEKGNLAPFNSEAKDVKHFWLRELTSDGYQNKTVIEENHPYIIAMPTSDSYSPEFRLNGTVTFSAEDVDLSKLTWEPVASKGATYTMYPTFCAVGRANDIYVLNTYYWIDGYDYGHVFMRSINGVEPYQAYVKPNDGTATMRSVLPMADGKRIAVRGVSSSGDASSRGAYGHRKPQIDDM